MRKTLLYDVTVFDNGLNKNAGRSGIFFTSLELLRQFMESQQFDIYLYYQGMDVGRLARFLERELNIRLPFYPKVSFADKQIAVFMDLKRQYKKEKKTIRKILSKGPLIFWKIIKKFEVFEPQKKFDIFFSPVFKVPQRVQSKKNFVVLYDAIPLLMPKYFEGVEVDWFAQLVDEMREEDYYFAISESTKRDFLKFVPRLQASHIFVTPLAASKSFYQEKNSAKQQNIREKYHIPADKKYVFSLCTLEPRKNLIRAVKTFIQFIRKNNIDDLVFVLGGGHWDKFIHQMEQEISDLGEYKDKIIRAGYVDDEDLSALYSGAEWFVYTSQYEGFGLPPLEAMQCGCPVITSNNSSLPEVVGNAGIMIDWDSDEQHINAYEQLYFNDDLRQSLSDKGLSRAQQFSWKKTVDLMIKEMNK